MRRKNLTLITISLAIVISLALGACTPTAPKPPGEKAREVTIAGGSIGGGASLFCNAYAAILRRELGVNATVLTMPCNVAQDAIHNGLTDIGSPTMDLLYESYTGTGSYAGEEPYSELRLVLYSCMTPLQVFVPVDSDIKTFRDLVGKRLSPGQKGQSPYSFLNKGLPLIGLSYEDDFDWVYMGHAEGGAALVSGKIAAYIACMDPPHPTFMEVDLTHPLRLVAFNEEDLAVILENVQGAMLVPIEAKYYHMTEPIQTWGIPCVEATTNRLPEDISYTLVKTCLEDPEFVGAFISSVGEFFASPIQKMLAEETRNSPPYHIGTYRYYQERGWKVSPEMIPPEAK